jgi:hypothetical protein
MLTVFVQYFISKTPVRQKELDLCILRNIENPLISKFIVYFEKEADMPSVPDHPRVEKRFYAPRMTYGFWLKETEKLPVGELSILINTDMYLTDSVSHLIAQREKILSEKRFIALSRYNPNYESNPEEFVLNKDPHWTQDVWGVARLAEPFPAALLQEAAFELGQPGCDNKIAYVMHSYGFNVTNPCYSVKTIHLQADDGRSYDPKISKLIGLHAFVHPTNSVTEDSLLDFDLLTRSNKDPIDIRVNNWINNRRSYELRADINPENKATATVKPALVEKLEEPAFNIADLDDSGDTAEHQILDEDAYVLRTRFKSNLFREVVRFTDRFVVYEDYNAYYFYDKFWPVVKRILKSDITITDISKTNFHFFAIGFLPANLSLGIVDMSNEMEYGDDVLFWQYPCRTEADAYEAHQYLQGALINGHIVDTYIALPWATFVDKKSYPEGILGLYASRIKAAKEIAGTFGFTVRVNTVCQHIFWRDIQPYFEKVGITNLWISHKENALDKLGNGIYLHAWPLYAVNYLDRSRRPGMHYIPTDKKTIFASFVGAHMKHYLSDVRVRLKELANLPGFQIEIKDLWHFNKVVYNFQVAGNFEHKDSTQMDEAYQYNQTLSNSLFSLCPVGAGPNSLRLWESLAIGAIPVNLSDRLQLPALDFVDPEKKLRWEDAIIFHAEKDLNTLEARLRSLSPEKLQSMQDTGREIFKRIQNLVCFGKIARRNVDGFDLMREFKPQQIHITGKTAPVFDGVASKIPASFEVGAEWVEAVIHFDQTERLYALHFDVESAPGQSVEIEIYRYQEFMKFTTLFDSKIIKKPGQYSYPLNEGEVLMAMGLKLRMRSNTADVIKIRAVPEVHTNYFAKQMQQLDASGYLKAASDSGPTRQDPLFDTKNIESGLILETLPAIIKPEEVKADHFLFPRLEERKVNLIGEPLNQGISLYVHLMNRNENVQANLPNWLTQKFDEIILLDWSSKDPVASIPNLFDDPRVRVVRVEGQEKFIRTLAQNLATEMARNTHVFKCDSDVLFKGDFFVNHALNKGEFWVGDWHQGRDYNERHLHGETYYHVDDFFRVNGYDERIMAYGHDDTNLKDRMVLAGMIKKVFSYNQLHHIHHPQETRATNQDMVHPMVKIFENRIAARAKTLWTSTDKALQYTRKPVDESSEYEKQERVIIFTANEKRQPQYDQVVEDAAINEVSGWYTDQINHAQLNREQKIKLIWEKQVE